MSVEPRSWDETSVIATVDAAARRRRPEPIEWIALTLALAPFVVAVVRAGIQRWMPVGDAAYFTVRSRDVLTAHTPLIGAWSSGSSVVGRPVNNLGPLQLNLLAPFTRLLPTVGVSPYLGTGIGSAVVNSSGVVIVWFVARRLFSPIVVVWVMAGTTLFVATLGLAWLIDARQQFAMVIPFFALLWLCAGMWAGAATAVPIGLVTASLLLQTHFTFAYQTVVVTVSGVVGYVLAARRTSGPDRWGGRVAIVSAAAVALVWTQPLLDQFFGTGNFGRVLGPARGSQTGVGWETGIQVVAGASLAPPFWLPGSIGAFLAPFDGITTGPAVLTVVAWLVASTAIVRLGVVSDRRGVVAVGAASLVALLGALVAATLIPVSSFGLVPQNYYWVWSVGAFVTIALLAGVFSLPSSPRTRAPRHGPSRRLRISSVAGRPGVAVAVLAATLALAVWPRYPVLSVRRDEVEAERIGRPLREQLEAAFQSGVVDDTVEVDLSRAFFGNNYPYVMLVELQRAGIEFRFPPENRNLDRFGRSRCATSGEHQRILIIAGRDPSLVPGSIVIAEVAGITDTELDEYAVLRERFGELLRTGEVRVDLDAVTDELDADVDEVTDVMATDGMDAGGLARALDHWRTWGYVHIPPSQRPAFDRWFDLERRSSADYQTVVLEDPAGSRSGDPAGNPTGDTDANPAGVEQRSC